MKKIVLFDIDYTLFDTDVFRNSDLKDFVVYQEVDLVLHKLEKVALLGIFSEGGIDLQRKKLQETKILKHFIQEHVHIVVKKEDELRKILDTYANDTLFLIDDKLTILYNAKHIMPSLFTIWVKRGKYAINQRPLKDFKADAQVDSLLDVVDIIKNN